MCVCPFLVTMSVIWFAHSLLDCMVAFSVFHWHLPLWCSFNVHHLTVVRFQFLANCYLTFIIKTIVFDGSAGMFEDFMCVRTICTLGGCTFESRVCSNPKNTHDYDVNGKYVCTNSFSIIASYYNWSYYILFEQQQQ